jgi:hypothetical protein
MSSGVIDLPEHLQSLQVLANPWVMGAAGIAAVVEFFADKVAWLDSVWDGVHTFIRPVGRALLAHGGKAGARAVINTSPEPVTNVAMSTVEDVATAGLLYAVYEYPYAAGAIALVLLGLAIWLLLLARRIIKRIFGQPKETGGV